MTTSIISSLQNNYNIAQPSPNYQSPYCILQWRRGQLLVKSPGKLNQPYLPSLDNKQLLVECLKNSPVTLVSIDPKLGDATVQFWADACKEAKKSIFLRLPSGHQLLKSESQALQIIKRLIDWVLALILLIVFSPLMLGLIIFMWIESPKLIFTYDWHIGEKGKLFQAIKFCSITEYNFTPVGLWMSKYGLENLPKLFNVLQGEMSLLGYRCWCLDDAIKLNIIAQRKYLYRLPGMINLGQIETKLKLAKW
jgi:hypothetical protein